MASYQNVCSDGPDFVREGITVENIEGLMKGPRATRRGVTGAGVLAIPGNSLQMTIAIPLTSTDAGLIAGSVDSECRREESLSSRAPDDGVIV